MNVTLKSREISGKKGSDEGNKIGRQKTADIGNGLFKYLFSSLLLT